jgi:dipeptidase E
MAPRQILAFGGVDVTSPAHAPLTDFLLELAGVERPRMLFIGTASFEAPEYALAFYEAFGHRASASHLSLFPWPPAELRARILEQDVVYVGGGNTASMLAVWRVHGVDELLREAWERGVVLAGVSAGMICWFEAGVTDSFGPELAGFEDGLGFLRGSACPHYDGEERRRPVYRRLVADGFPPGLAADDGAALHFVEDELADVVAVGGATAYRVDRNGETRLDARRLD